MSFHRGDVMSRHWDLENSKRITLPATHATSFQRMRLLETRLQCKCEQSNQRLSFQLRCAGRCAGISKMDGIEDFFRWLDFLVTLSKIVWSNQRRRKANKDYVFHGIYFWYRCLVRSEIFLEKLVFTLMGVKGLWQLLESVGRPVTLESLENKVLGVDIL